MEHSPRVNLPGNGFNADRYGDQIVDTHVYVDIDHFDANCNYTGGAYDCNNMLIVAEPTAEGYMVHPSLGNFMYAGGITSGAGCTPIFTPGQGKRMREAITGTNANYFSGLMNTIESLYQPFETTEIGGDNVVSVTDNFDGTATVCRSIVRRDRFQKGFDCIYYGMDDSVIDTSVPDNLKVISERTFDYKVKIMQVDQVNTEIVSVVCTRGVICNVEPYVSGIILSMKTLGSMNITVKELNEAQVNDPNLFDQLMEKYYHIIKKETESGVIDEKIIYKP
ncbi:MAG TPA: hypothetical protein VLB74_01815 [Flavobacterium sp.]|uniref:hypothetical protein n=1 Tax=Flavobacterium sp. TaxID=239 RepID=UPI002C6883D5|nr:hypothetical protein [Flavobacterium sp.]HSD13365.1 hypothetical protein [Flavobacterium sp.]